VVPGLQTWFIWVHKRGFATLFYASVQWSLYLIFAATASACRSRLSIGRRPIHLYILWAITTLVAAPAASVFNDVFFSPLIYLPHFALGVVPGRYLLEYEGHSLVMSSSTSSGHLLAIYRVISPVDLLAILIAWVILDYPHLGGYGRLDDTISLIIFPGLSALLVVLLWQEAGTGREGVVGRLLLPSEALVVLGRLSYALYLFHEIIANYYLQLAVNYPYFTLFPPKDTPYSPDIMPILFEWINHQGFFLKVFAACAVVCFSWLVQRYYHEGVVLHLAGKCAATPSLSPNYDGSPGHWGCSCCRRRRHRLPSLPITAVVELVAGSSAVLSGASGHTTGNSDSSISISGGSGGKREGDEAAQCLLDHERQSSISGKSSVTASLQC